MPHRSDESLFAAFRGHRDCHALGLLFHRRADELLRLAVFLGPRPSDAEDLVQATFLSAIARAETFRPGHRVMSWLCGILTNHARMLRRAAKRSPPDAQDNLVEDPVEAALRSELRSALTAGIAGLPEPYRSVLSLHLESGLDSQEISQRLARPPATVRKQMERALDRLRVALPLGLATAIVARVQASQLALHAADAAQFVDPIAAPAMSAAPAAAPWRWLAAGTVAVAFASYATTVWLLPASEALPAAPGEPLAAAAAANAAASDAATVAAGNAAGPEAAVSGPARRPAATTCPSLVVRVVQPQGAPVADFEVLAVADDGRALPERLVSRNLLASARTDEGGQARFTDLPLGAHDITFPGAVARMQIVLTADGHDCRLELPEPTAIRGIVVDGNGVGVPDAEIVVSESSLRGDLGAVAAMSQPDGSFALTSHLANGRVFARRADFGIGLCARLEPDRELRLVLPTAGRVVDVLVQDPRGAPVADAYVALVPRSFAMSLYPPQHTRTDERGHCRLQDPGPREATVLASFPGLAPVAFDLPAETTSLGLQLQPGGTLNGRVVDDAGQGLANLVVVATVADQRSNEPVAPLVARRVRTGEDGSFAFPHLPPGPLQVRVHGPVPTAPGLVPFPHVLAAADVEVTNLAASQVTLTAQYGASLRGRLVTPDGSGVAGWNVMATPTLGVALHRLFRGRGAPTAADGTFEILDLVGDEWYQVGALQPGAPRLRDGNLPYATGVGRPGAEPVTLVVDPENLPASRLRCRVLAPNGQPCHGAALELRAVRFQSPTTKSTAADGSCEWSQLAPGAYWLAIVAPGLGTRTLPVTIEDGGRDLDLGTITLEPGARLLVHVHGALGNVPAGTRVVGQNTVGDKFVAALTDARGMAALPVLPPGETRLLVHGAGIAPCLRVLELAAGTQTVDVEVAPGASVPITATFPLADNPFTVNGPLHMQVWSGDALVFEDFVGAISSRGQFDLSTGLPPGAYRVVARALWNARAEASFVVDGTGPVEPIALRLAR